MSDTHDPADSLATLARMQVPSTTGARPAGLAVVVASTVVFALLAFPALALVTNHNAGVELALVGAVTTGIAGRPREGVRMSADARRPTQPEPTYHRRENTGGDSDGAR